MVILLMGVSGVGKTTVGTALAKTLGWRFLDADDFHSPANVAKLHAGLALDDADRAPWLRSLRDAIETWIAKRESMVFACSALKESYRRQLVVGPEVRLVFLRAEFSVVSEHLAHRHGHFMNAALLQSQFETLEPPTDALVIDAAKPVPEIVADICAALGLASTIKPPQNLSS